MKSRVIILGLAVLLGLGWPAGAADRVATPSADANGLYWAPLGDHQGLVLTVSGQGHWARTAFEPEESPSFGIVDASGARLPDGSYTWELRVLPEDPPKRRAAAGGGGSERGARGPVASGYFEIRDGAVVFAEDAVEAGTPRVSEGPELQTRDQVILDDLIVDGSACVGMDCANGESFGFDTLRLKENNLRIKFEDTSNSASFPSNDWQLTANDTNNGGANRFSIDDVTGSRTPFTIEAGAPSHSLYVDDGGRIGLGTSTPVVQLHVVDGNTPTLRLEQDGSSGFSAQTWDVAGNETNFFVRDATNGSKLPFKIFPNAPTNSLIVEGTTGDVGVGIQSPTAPLHVYRNSSSVPTKLLVEQDGTAGGFLLDLLELNAPASKSAGLRIASNNDTYIWRNFVNQGDGDFRMSVVAGGTGVPFDLDVNGNLTITGNLVTGGGGACDPGPCDGVFGPGYEVESIEEHAAFMWANQHLWGVGPTPEGAPINLTQKTTGILHELEKAHIYIEQLNARLADKEREIRRLREEGDALSARLDRLEQALGSPE